MQPSKTEIKSALFQAGGDKKVALATLREIYASGKSTAKADALIHPEKKDIHRSIPVAVRGKVAKPARVEVIDLSAADVIIDMEIVEPRALTDFLDVMEAMQRVTNEPICLTFDKGGIRSGQRDFTGRWVDFVMAESALHKYKNEGEPSVCFDAKFLPTSILNVEKLALRLEEEAANIILTYNEVGEPAVVRAIPFTVGGRAPGYEIADTKFGQIEMDGLNLMKGISGVSAGEDVRVQGVDNTVTLSNENSGAIYKPGADGAQVSFRAATDVRIPFDDLNRALHFATRPHRSITVIFFEMGTLYTLSGLARSQLRFYFPKLAPVEVKEEIVSSPVVMAEDVQMEHTEETTLVEIQMFKKNAMAFFEMADLMRDDDDANIGMKLTQNGLEAAKQDEDGVQVYYEISKVDIEKNGAYTFTQGEREMNFALDVSSMPEEEDEVLSLVLKVAAGADVMQATWETTYEDSEDRRSTSEDWKMVPTTSERVRRPEERMNTTTIQVKGAEFNDRFSMLDGFNEQQEDISLNPSGTGFSISIASGPSTAFDTTQVTVFGDPTATRAIKYEQLGGILQYLDMDGDLLIGMQDRWTTFTVATGTDGQFFYRVPFQGPAEPPRSVEEPAFESPQSLTGDDDESMAEDDPVLWKAKYEAPMAQTLMKMLTGMKNIYQRAIPVTVTPEGIFVEGFASGAYADLYFYGSSPANAANYFKSSKNIKFKLDVSEFPTNRSGINTVAFSVEKNSSRILMKVKEEGDQPEYFDLNFSEMNLKDVEKPTPPGDFTRFAEIPSNLFAKSLKAISPGGKPGDKIVLYSKKGQIHLRRKKQDVVLGKMEKRDRFKFGVSLGTLRRVMDMAGEGYTVQVASPASGDQEVRFTLYLDGLGWMEYHMETIASKKKIAPVQEAPKRAKHSKAFYALFEKSYALKQALRSIAIMKKKNIIRMYFDKEGAYLNQPSTANGSVRVYFAIKRGDFDDHILRGTELQNKVLLFDMKEINKVWTKDHDLVMNYSNGDMKVSLVPNGPGATPHDFVFRFEKGMRRSVELVEPIVIVKTTRQEFADAFKRASTGDTRINLADATADELREMLETTGGTTEELLSRAKKEIHASLSAYTKDGKFTMYGKEVNGVLPVLPLSEDKTEHSTTLNATAVLAILGSYSEDGNLWIKFYPDFIDMVFMIRAEMSLVYRIKVPQVIEMEEEEEVAHDVESRKGQDADFAEIMGDFAEMQRVNDSFYAKFRDSDNLFELLGFATELKKNTVLALQFAKDGVSLNDMKSNRPKIAVNFEVNLKADGQAFDAYRISGTWYEHMIAEIDFDDFFDQWKADDNLEMELQNGQMVVSLVSSTAGVETRKFSYPLKEGTILTVRDTPPMEKVKTDMETFQRALNTAHEGRVSLMPRKATVSELEDFLRGEGLEVSGTQEELAELVINHGPNVATRVDLADGVFTMQGLHSDGTFKVEDTSANYSGRIDAKIFGALLNNDIRGFIEVRFYPKYTEVEFSHRGQKLEIRFRSPTGTDWDMVKNIPEEKEEDPVDVMEDEVPDTSPVAFYMHITNGSRAMRESLKLLRRLKKKNTIGLIFGKDAISLESWNTKTGGVLVNFHYETFADSNYVVRGLEDKVLMIDTKEILQNWQNDHSLKMQFQNGQVKVTLVPSVRDTKEYVYYYKFEKGKGKGAFPELEPKLIVMSRTDVGRGIMDSFEGFTEVDPANSTIDKLKDVLRRNKLIVGGKKDELVQRVQEKVKATIRVSAENGIVTFHGPVKKVDLPLLEHVPRVDYDGIVDAKMLKYLLAGDKPYGVRMRIYSDITELQFFINTHVTVTARFPNPVGPAPVGPAPAAPVRPVPVIAPVVPVIAPAPVVRDAEMAELPLILQTSKANPTILWATLKNLTNIVRGNINIYVNRNGFSWSGKTASPDLTGFFNVKRPYFDKYEGENVGERVFGMNAPSLFSKWNSDAPNVHIEADDKAIRFDVDPREDPVSFPLRNEIAPDATMDLPEDPDFSATNFKEFWEAFGVVNVLGAGEKLEIFLRKGRMLLKTAATHRAVDMPEVHTLGHGDILKYAVHMGALSLLFREAQMQELQLDVHFYNNFIYFDFTGDSETVLMRFRLRTTE